MITIYSVSSIFVIFINCIHKSSNLIFNLIERYFKYGRPVRYRYFGDFLNQTVFDTICFKYTSPSLSAFTEDELDKLHLIQQAYYYCIVRYLMSK